MPEYEGFIASLKEDGRAEGIVHPQISGIAGAPAARKKACHCTSNNSQVTMDALNPSRAAAGDRVAVKVEASVFVRNAGALIGIPVLALALGWMVSLLIPEKDLLGLPQGPFRTGMGPGTIFPV